MPADHYPFGLTVPRRACHIIYAQVVTAERIGPPQPGVRAVELGEDISLYNPRTHGVALLNGTASDVWRLVDGEHTLEEIVALLGAVYDADVDVIRQGVVRTVADLVAGGFL